MSEKFDLQRMLVEIQEDEAVDAAKTPHLSQEQIQELIARRKAQDSEQGPKQAPKPKDAK